MTNPAAVEAGQVSADLALLGHVCRDEIIPFRGEPTIALGSAVLCGAFAAAASGANVAVVTRMASDDDALLTELRARGIAVHATPSDATTYMRVEHPSSDVDDRVMRQLASAGPFRLDQLPTLAVRHAHLAGISDQEFDLGFVRGVRRLVPRLSADMQSFVRQVEPASGRICFGDVPEKAAIVGLLDVVKLDVVEARILTGTDDLGRAAMAFEHWGCPEVMVSRADGVLLRAAGRTHWEPFTNRNDVGRTGRGDTLFAAYAARRLHDEPAEALRFAAALVSLKMESPGPFRGTDADVLERLRTSVAA